MRANPRRFPLLALSAFGFCLAVLSVDAFAQIEFEREPINYQLETKHDPIARLQAALKEGKATLEHDERRGYLPALLEALNIPESSQTLVFSKTSFQLSKITPARPRALYFSDDVYVGWVQHGDVVEITSVDPQQGAVFYTLDQMKAEKPEFVRDRGQCLICHASSRTQGVPGHVVRSVFVSRSGQLLLGAGTYTTDHRSPFEERWGGWYVTGTHGQMRHMGNVMAQNANEPENLDREAGANVTDLSGLIDTSPYLAPTSDIVALMVLEHQTQMHNRITLASYEARSANHYDQIMNKALDRPEDYQSESAQRRIAAAGDKLLEYLLMAEEFPLASPVAGVSSFAEEFAARGPTDSKGRSLRDLDLQTRLFKHPCSYLIYSPCFDQLPAPVKDYVVKRLRGVLDGTDNDKAFAHLSAADRTAIREILQETKPELFEPEQPIPVGAQ